MRPCVQVNLIESRVLGRLGQRTLFISKKPFQSIPTFRQPTTITQPQARYVNSRLEILEDLEYRYPVLVLRL